MGKYRIGKKNLEIANLCRHIEEYNDPQPKERVKSEIVFDHIVDQAMTGYNWVA